MPKTRPVTESFAILQTWARIHATDVTFRPPAPPKAIDNFTEKSGLDLLPDLRQYLLIADGETRKSAGMIGNWRLMPIAEIQAAWGMLTKLAEKGAFTGKQPCTTPYIKEAWWHAGWIPFVSSDTGHYFCLDTDPSEPLRTGQVLIFLQDRPERYLIAPNLGAWFDRIARDLDAGLYTYDQVNGFNGEAFMWSALEGKHLFDNPKGQLIVQD